MSKKIYLLPVLLLAFVFVSCDETKETSEYDNWQVRNDVFMDSLQTVYDAKTDPDLKFVVDESNKKNIFYKKLSADPNHAQKESPYYTSTVSMFYRGMFINEAIFGAAPNPRYYTKLYSHLTKFDQNFKGDNPEKDTENPTVFNVSGLTTGWMAILQHMKPGERWEVYVPWKSAYGSAGYKDIPGYSTLIFDMEILKVTKY